MSYQGGLQSETSTMKLSLLDGTAIVKLGKNDMKKVGDGLHGKAMVSEPSNGSSRC